MKPGIQAPASSVNQFPQSETSHECRFLFRPRTTEESGADYCDTEAFRSVQGEARKEITQLNCGTCTTWAFTELSNSILGMSSVVGQKSSRVTK